MDRYIIYLNSVFFMGFKIFIYFYYLLLFFDKLENKLNSLSLRNFKTERKQRQSLCDELNKKPIQYTKHTYIIYKTIIISYTLVNDN